jgi:heme a synthase
VPVHRLPRISPAGYRRITLLVLVALCFIIVTGGAVRLTGSGLGCSDWPGCEQEQFVAPLELHPMVEWVNRLITGAVSVCIVAAVLGSLRRTPRRRDLVWWSLGLVVGLVGQIVLGAFTVEYDLAPPLVMGHLILSLLLVTNGVVLHHLAGRPDGAGAPVPVVSQGARRLVVALVPALAAAVLAGTIVTGSGPHGGDEEAPRFGFDIEAVTRVHSLAVLVFLGVLLAVLNRLNHEGAPPSVTHRARQLLMASVAQAAVGWTQYFMDVPALLVGVHLAGATVVWLALWRLLLAARRDAAVEPTTAPVLVGHASGLG